MGRFPKRRFGSGEDLKMGTMGCLYFNIFQMFLCPDKNNGLLLYKSMLKARNISVINSIKLPNCHPLEILNKSTPQKF